MMLRITGVALPYALILLACSAGFVLAAETRMPTQEEFREQMRQLNESGRYIGGPSTRPVMTPVSKAVEQFQRAVSLHGKKGASPSELKEAASLYQAASDAGMPQASTNLAFMYMEGKGVKKDVRKAIALLNTASKKDVPQADLALARLYLVGKDVKRDEKKGEWHLDKAARTGNPTAVKMLADYKEWKKKNDLAMKQYQEILKKAQMNAAMQRGSSIAPSPAKTASQMQAPWAPFPIIPGQSYLQNLKPAVNSPPPQPAKVDKINTKVNTVLPQPVEVPKTAESGSDKPAVQTQPKPAGQEQISRMPEK